MKYNIPFIIALIILISSCSSQHEEHLRPVSKVEQKRAAMIYDSLSNLHYALPAPQKGDWLEAHPEKAESFQDYVEKWPQTKTAKRTKLYLVKLSPFMATQQVIFDKTMTYLSLFYDTEVDTFTLNIDYENIPEKFFRKNDLQEIQVLTDFFLKKELLKALPDDAWGLIGCTAVDIFPDPKWNFVFGQASLSNRVGVWSMRRLGDIENYPETKNRAFMRNLKVASHETGHMISMKHCVYYDCLMNGSAHILENDAKPPYLCPVCLAKADWNRNFDLHDRFDQLFTFWNENQYDIYHQYYEIVKEVAIK